MSGVVIIGAGHAAGQAAASLRQAKYEGDITIIGEEAHIPYQRPPLSKAYLKGEQSADKVYLRAESFYADRNITMKLSITATAIDTVAKTVALNTDEALSYDHLLISTGSRPRKLSIKGSGLPGIHYLRTMDDVDGLREGMRPDANLVIVGG
ncbi:MAG: FAD-dependent oxidoreductase, partial [Proteobacteria bacterium]|nr:FAD-dependent oxidoreductase [Pseudomonadota bacterium]